MRWASSTTRNVRVLSLAVALLILSQAGELWSQPKQGPELPQPRVLILSPCGGQAGTAVEVQITGQDLDHPQGLLFDHPGFKAEPVGAPMVVKAEPTNKRGMQQPNATA